MNDKKLTDLRNRVMHSLEQAGVHTSNRQNDSMRTISKDQARTMHAYQRKMLLQKNVSFIHQWADSLTSYFAKGYEVDLGKFTPLILPVEDDSQNALFKLASLSWSVPVSNGYGRRKKFIVLDSSNNKLVGIFALGDPVINLGVRDAYIGWTREQKYHHLYNVFDAFVCGSVSPYREILAGKLIAMLTTSQDALLYLENKYRNSKSVISQIQKDSTIAAISVTSALGRSSIYNRISLPNGTKFKSLGFTEGYGHFQFSDDIFKDLLQLASTHPKFQGARFGDGSNWKIRALQLALRMLDLSPSLIKHGIRREFFFAELGEGARLFLQGANESFNRREMSASAIGEFFVNRWATKRLIQVENFEQIDGADYIHKLKIQI